MKSRKKMPEMGTGGAMPVSIYSKIERLSQPAGSMNVFELVAYIKDDRLKDKVGKYRQLIQEGKHREAEALKKGLPGVTISGLFEPSRAARYLKEYSYCIVLDFDKIPKSKLQSLRRKVNDMPTTLISYCTVSGEGLKAIVRINSSVEHHRIAYEQVAKYYEEQLGLKADMKNKDLARLTFLSHDPDMFFNPNAEIFQIDTEDSNGDNAISDKGILSDQEQLFFKAVKYTDNRVSLAEGDRNNYIYLLSNNCNRYGIPRELIIELIDKYVSHGLPVDEVNATVKSAYDKNCADFGKWSPGNSNSSNSGQPSLQLSEEAIEKLLRKVLSEFLTPSSLNSK